MIEVNHWHYKLGGAFVGLLAVLCACKVDYVAVCVFFAGLAAVILLLWREKLTRQRIVLKEESERKSGLETESCTKDMKSITPKKQRRRQDHSGNEENMLPSVFNRRGRGLFKDSVLSDLSDPALSLGATKSKTENRIQNDRSLFSSFANSTPVSPGYATRSLIPASRLHQQTFLTETSFLGSPVSPVPLISPQTLSVQQLSPTPVMLPRVRRVDNSSSFNDAVQPAFTRGILQAHRRYPTHQPKYGGLGVMPTIRLQSPSRGVLNNHNSSMLKNSVTVKVAPPDVLKSPTPILLQVGEAEELPTAAAIPSTVANSSSTEMVLSALREKRKRNLKDDETVSVSPDGDQASKRRRQQSELPDGSLPNGGLGMDATGSGRQGLKRPAIRQTSPADTEASSVSKRTRAEARAASTVRNPIEVSFSSSRRWLNRQVRERSLSRSLDNSLCGSFTSSGRPQSREVSCSRHSSRAPSELFNSQQTSRHSSPQRHGITADEESSTEDGVARGSAASTSSVMLDGSARSSPLTLENGRDLSEGETKSGAVTPKKKRTALLQKDGSTKRRLTPLHMDLAKFLTKVPSLNQTMTMDDMVQDTEAELKQVQDMLDDVDEAERIKQEKKLHSRSATPVPSASSKLQTVAPAASSSTSVSTASSAVAPITLMSSAPISQSTSSVAVTSPPTNQSVPATTTSQAGFNISSLQPASASTGQSQLGAASLSQPGTLLASVTGGLSQGLSVTSAASAPTLSTASVATSTATSTSLPVPADDRSKFLPPTSSAASSSTSTPFSFRPIFSPSQTASEPSVATVTSTAAASKPACGFSFGGTVTTSQSTPKPPISLGIPHTATTSAAPPSGGFGPNAGMTQMAVSAGVLATSVAHSATGIFTSSVAAAATTAPAVSSSANATFTFGGASQPTTQGTSGSAGIAFGTTATAPPNRSAFALAVTASSSFPAQVDNASTAAQMSGAAKALNFNAQSAVGNASSEPGSFGVNKQTGAPTTVLSFKGQTTKSSTASPFQFAVKSTLPSTASPLTQTTTLATTTSAVTFGGFGQTITTTTPSIFGQSTHDPPFGSTQNQSASTGFQFSAVVTKSEAPKATFGFGQPQNTQSSTGIFGKTATTTAAPFGQQAAQSGSMFGGNSAVPSGGSFGASSAPAFGAPATGGTTVSNFGATAAFGGSITGSSTANKGFDFGQAAAGGAKAFNFSGNSGQQPQGTAPTFAQPAPTTPAFGAPQGNTAPSFGSTGTSVVPFQGQLPAGGPAMFSMGSSSTVPKQRAGARSRRRPKK